MSEFKALDDGKLFMQPESPFFLLTEDADGNVSYCWWDNEDNMKEDAVERRGAGERIICAIEISSCRDVEIPPGYTVEDFIEKVNEVYDEAKSQNLSDISIEIWTDAEEIFYINDEKKGFQCPGFDFLFEDLESVAEALFTEQMIGTPCEFKIISR